MRIGYGEQIITPLRGSHKLAGYIKRKKPFSCILDDIRIKTLVIEDVSGKTLVISSADLLAIDEMMFSSMSMLVKEITGQNHFIASATHTHSAPGTLFRGVVLQGLQGQEFDEEYFNYFLDQFRVSLESAVNSMGSAECYTTTVEMDKGFATNRIDPDIPIDNKVVLLKCISEKIKAGIVNYGVHPTVLGPDNMCISRDVAGAIEDLLRKETGINYVFINGAAADISTRFTRRNQTYDEVLRLATLFVSKTLEGASMGRWCRLKEQLTLFKKESLKLDVDTAKFEKMVKEYSLKLGSIELQNMPKHERVVESIREGIEAGIQMLNAIKNISKIDIEIPAYLLGGILGIIGLPGEALSRVSSLCREIVGSYLIFTGYSNGYYGYFSDREEPETYEDLMTIFSGKSIKELLDAIRKQCLWLRRAREQFS